MSGPSGLLVIDKPDGMTSHQVVAAVRAVGYRYVTIDLEGFRSGNLNSAL